MLARMNTDRSFEHQQRSGLRLTNHAVQRLYSRSFSRDRVETTLAFGREVHSNGITFYVVGRKEVVQAREQGLDISFAEGMHVLCSREGAIVTMYRNHDLRDVRPRITRFRSRR
jgi:hypothetical protein